MLSERRAQPAAAQQSLEECILNALSEDGVQECMQLADEAATDEVDELDVCLMQALSEDGVQECMQMADERRDASQTHLEASLSRESPPMRDAALIRAKAGAAAAIDGEREAPTALEQCIVDATNEDGVQECMQMYMGSE